MCSVKVQTQVWLKCWVMILNMLLKPKIPEQLLGFGADCFPTLGQLGLDSFFPLMQEIILQ